MLLRQKRFTDRSAFTLMEIIVVVAIILILAGAGIVVYSSMLGDANVNRAKMDVKNLQTAISTYNVRNKSYPESLDILCERDPNTGAAAILVEAALTDPWGVRYIYERETRHPKTDIPRIYTNGEPGKGPIVDNWGDSASGG